MATIEFSAPAPDSYDDQLRYERWAAIRERTTRGMLLFNGGAVHHLEGARYAVQSSAGGFWQVDFGAEQSCECPDFTYRAGAMGAPCKHLAAVGVYLGTRRSHVREVRTVDVAGGDPFRASGSRRLRELQEKYNHELLPDGERQRVRDEILRLRRRRGKGEQ